MCILSALISIFNLIMTICVLFADEESRINQLYDAGVTITFIVVALVLLVIGLISEIRKDKELYAWKQ